MNDYRFIIDQSTSGTKLLVMNAGKIMKRYDKMHQQIYPKDGWIEQDPEEIWHNVEALINQAFTENQLHHSQIASLSITNQRETIVAWDKVTGKPLYNAIVWQCNRSIDICERLIQQGKADVISQKTGLRVDPYFSGTKIQWLYDEIPMIREKSQAAELAIGTMDSWLIWKLTNGEVFATEASNASRTLLFDIQNLRWDSELANLFHCHIEDLPEIRNSSDIFGSYQGIVIKGVMADSQAALFGQGCLKKGEVKVTLGTGSSVLMQMKKEGDFRDQRIMTTVAGVDNQGTSYALEGIIRSCADSIHWFNEEIASFLDINQACNLAVSGQSEEIYFIPALQGLAAPFWLQESTGMFVGMRRKTTKLDLLRAILESIIFQIKAVIDVMEEVTGRKIKTVKVDGGVTKNTQLMILLADLLEKEVVINNMEELSAIGALNMVDDKVKNIELSPKSLYPRVNQPLSKKYKQWRDLITISSNNETIEIVS
ncbi:FGGY family carbohydrate kinase [Enterococcus avium]|uniref:FGGY-family carbohydrate kinase n=1 Tax=Enterococcus avium TaxID=33945 RepID=UPI0025B19E5F|nr:FGGY family carbohydrate kinase [Enterococcus avium]MDN2638025.1 FGGY family carbohydrate kinase [Enterococcus avium]